MKSKSYIDQLTYAINGAAIDVHRALGPGLLESVYQKCLAYELKERKVSYEYEQQVPIFYKEMNLDAHIRCDIIVEKLIVIEIKSVEHVLPIHNAQLMTYMKLLQAPKGIMLNFNVVNLIKQGQRTFVNEYFANCPA